jgi:hypothetical protein
MNAAGATLSTVRTKAYVSHYLNYCQTYTYVTSNFDISNTI